MPHSHVFCLVHLVLSTSGRQPIIRESMQARLHAYLGGIARENAMVAIAVGGVSDHVHLLLSLPSTIPIAKAVQLLKSGSSKWTHESFPQSRGFSWLQGYGAFSVSISQQAKTGAYIHAQAKHHERVSSAEEFRRFLMAHAILP
jgi:REP-associated tyrosine transposase